MLCFERKLKKSFKSCFSCPSFLLTFKTGSLCVTQDGLQLLVSLSAFSGLLVYRKFGLNVLTHEFRIFYIVMCRKGRRNYTCIFNLEMLTLLLLRTVVFSHILFLLVTKALKCRERIIFFFFKKKHVIVKQNTEQNENMLFCKVVTKFAPVCSPIGPSEIQLCL